MVLKREEIWEEVRPGMEGALWSTRDEWSLGGRWWGGGIEEGCEWGEREGGGEVFNRQYFDRGRMNRPRLA